MPLAKNRPTLKFYIVIYLERCVAGESGPRISAFPQHSAPRHQGTVHAIKASNILIFGNGRVKIGDLNVSKLDNGLSYTRTGTLTYASPEVWKGDRYDSKCDVWSLGCLLYEMICLRKPFYGESMEEIYRRITKGQYDRIVNDSYSKELKDLPTYMLQLNPKLRPSAATLCKMSKNRCKRIDEGLPKIMSFNLVNVVVPGLEQLSIPENSSFLLSSSS